MKELAKSDFGDFYVSEFFSEFDNTDYSRNKIILESPESKLVSEIQEEMFDAFFILSFYKKGKERWVKKMEFSYEQVLYDCEVKLMGDDEGNPTSIIFDMGEESFEFILSPEMVRALQDAIKYDFEGYYPNLSKN